MDETFALAIGKAAIGVWDELPREVQEKLFEHAVDQGPVESRHPFREALATFLHGVNARTKK